MANSQHHLEQAEKALDIFAHESTRADASHVLAAAQVHATLALALEVQGAALQLRELTDEARRNRRASR